MPLRPRHAAMATMLLAALLSLPATPAWSAGDDAADPCAQAASPACYRGFEPEGAQGLRLHYYASLADDPGGAAPTHALVALHGHPRDAGKTFAAALLAVRRAGTGTLVVAPVFQVAESQSQGCRAAGVPAPQPGDLLWTCASWIEGGEAGNATGFTSFDALDALVTELRRRWPSLRSVTLAGFSAGAQMVQHHVGFSTLPLSGGLAIRHVVADPGTWLYFDTLRPRWVHDGVPVTGEGCSTDPDAIPGYCGIGFAPPDTADCPTTNRWKYGTEALPAALRRDAAAARARYAVADVSYLAGENDTGTGPGTFHRILDQSCAARAQGPYRLQRAQAYAQYDREHLAPGKARTLVVVPGCAHDVACVFPSVAARAALLGPDTGKTAPAPAASRPDTR